jgi:cobalt-zinc-cadmium efflux system outer membrane protein
MLLTGTLEQLATRTAVPASAAASLSPDRRPDVVAAREELHASRAERDLAGREAIPDVRLGAGYAHEEGADIVQALLSIDLPFFQRNQAERAAASARVARAESALGAAGGHGAEQIRSALSRRDAARALVADSGGATLAAADENATLVHEAYVAGKVGFLELLLVRRDALETRRAYLDALVELNAAEALLASALAGD